MERCMLEKLLSILKDHPLFNEVSEDYLKTKLQTDSFSLKEFKSHTVAYSSKTDSVCVGVILTGKVHVLANNGQDGTLLKKMNSGDIFGIANLYADHEPFPSKIITEASAKIAFIDGDKFKEIIEGDPTLLKNYLTYLTQKIIYLNKKVATFSADSSEKKLAIYIGENVKNGIFSPPCSMTQVAALLGMGRASLYRAIDCLRQHGIIEDQDDNSYRVNADKLRSFNK